MGQASSQQALGVSAPGKPGSKFRGGNHENRSERSRKVRRPDPRHALACALVSTSLDPLIHVLPEVSRVTLADTKLGRVGAQLDCYSTGPSSGLILTEAPASYVHQDQAKLRANAFFPVHR